MSNLACFSCPYVSLVLFLAAFKCPVSYFEKTDDISFRIVGGDTCEQKYPYFVSIQDSLLPHHFCGGSLIESTWVLTAAHCFYLGYIASEFKIYVGIYNVTERENAQSSIAKAVYVHPDFNETTYTNDIALIELLNPIWQSDQVRFVTFSSYVIGRPLCNKGTIMGFGEQQRKAPDGTILEPNNYTGSLQCGTVEVVSLVDCLLPQLNNTNKFCAMDTDHNSSTVDACQGDSGGPFMCGDVQYGIISSGIGCGFDGIPGTYTIVKKHTDFITRTMQSDGQRITLFRGTLLYNLFLLIIICACHV